jgi:hypothetical protein
VFWGKGPVKFCLSAFFWSMDRKSVQYERFFGCSRAQIYDFLEIDAPRRQ